MNRLVTEGDRVYIEFCVRCEQHQWCTKHSSDKYQGYFNSCKNELQRFKPGLRVLANEIPPKLTAKYFVRPEGEAKVVPGKLAFPRIGAFEVYYRGIVLFSKLSSGLWPRPELLCDTLAQALEDFRRKDEAAEERRHRKSSKSHKKKHRKKQVAGVSTRTTPTRTMKSSQEPFRQVSRRPMTSNPRYKSAKRSHSPATTVKKDYKDYSYERISKNSRVRHSSSSDKSARHMQDEGIQADRFEAPEIPPVFNQKEVWTNEQEVWNLEAEEQPRFVAAEQRPKTAKRPLESFTIPQEKEKTEESHSKQEVSGTVEVGYRPVEPVSKPPEPLNPASTVTNKSPEPVTIPPPEPVQTYTIDMSTDKLQEFSIPESSVSHPADAEKSSERAKSPESKSSSSKEERYSEDSEGYGSGEFEEEVREPVHPIRPVTKSYNVEIPMGKYTNKKISYVNTGENQANFRLISSHPQEMIVKEEEIMIEGGGKGPLKLQFNPVYEECEKTFYLYLDKGGLPCECFEFVVKFT